MMNTTETLRLAADRGVSYVERVCDRNVSPSAAAVAALAGFRETLPDASTDPCRVIEMLDDIGSPATVASTAGRYFGFVIGGVLPASMAATWLAAAWGQNAALRVMSPVAAELEDVVLGWICEALNLPRDCAGGFVTCATAANFSGLAAARSALLSREGWNVEDQGLFGAPPIDVIVGEECTRR